jgi:RND family efflux transporter MFP subunit
MAGPSAPVVRLVNNDEVDIVATISEKHFKNVKEGTAMTVDFPNYGDMSLELKVESVSNYIEATNRTFRIKSSVKDNKELLPNMLAEISITDLSVNKGIVIPAAAILIDQDSKDYVYIIEKDEDGDMASKKMIVTVVERYEGRALIKDGTITAGDKVVVKGARGISDKTKIQTTK